MAIVVKDPNDAQRKRAVRRTTILLSLLALTFYLGFIVMSVLKSL